MSAVAADARTLGIQAENHKLRELLLKAGADARDHELAEELQAVLVRELHHRMKNMLAIVSAVTTQTLRTASTMEEASTAIANRLHAFGLAQDLLVQDGPTSINCRLLIERAIAVFQTRPLRQFRLVGEDVRFTAGAATSLSMIIHELCTNAIKYGALSAPEGIVRISWSVDDDQRFTFSWIESGGPLVNEPSRVGFGIQLIKRSLPDQTANEPRLHFAPAGVECRINVPLDALQVVAVVGSVLRPAQGR